MRLEVIVKCHDCAKFNANKWDDTPRGQDPPEDKECEFTTFNDSLVHALANPDHVLYFIIRSENEDYD